MLSSPWENKKTVLQKEGGLGYLAFYILQSYLLETKKAHLSGNESGASRRARKVEAL